MAVDIWINLLVRPEPVLVRTLPEPHVAGACTHGINPTQGEMVNPVAAGLSPRAGWAVEFSPPVGFSPIWSVVKLLGTFPYVAGKQVFLF